MSGESNPKNFWLTRGLLTLICMLFSAIASPWLIAWFGVKTLDAQGVNSINFKMSEDGALEYHLVQPEDTTVSKIKTPNHTDSETANCCKNLEELKQLAQITDGTIVNYKDSINSLWDSIQRMPIPQSVCFEEKVFHDTDKFVFVNEIFFDPVSSIAMVIHDLTDREATGQICTAEGPIPFENIHETDNDWKITVCDKLYRVSIGSFSSNVNGTGQYHVRITKIPK